MNTQNSSTVCISLVHSVYLVYNYKITNSKDWEKEIYSKYVYITSYKLGVRKNANKAKILQEFTYRIR